MIAVVGLILGIAAGMILQPEVPSSLQPYLPIAIVAALAASRGHQGNAAALLGISRKGLWEKRKRLGIP